MRYLKSKGYVALPNPTNRITSIFGHCMLEIILDSLLNLDNCKNTFSTNQSNGIYTVKECIDEFTNPVECNPEPLDRLFQYLHLKSMG